MRQEIINLVQKRAEEGWKTLFYTGDDCNEVMSFLQENGATAEHSTGWASWNEATQGLAVQLRRKAATKNETKRREEFEQEKGMLLLALEEFKRVLQSGNENSENIQKAAERMGEEMRRVQDKAALLAEATEEVEAAEAAVKAAEAAEMAATDAMAKKYFEVAADLKEALQT